MKLKDFALTSIIFASLLLSSCGMQEYAFSVEDLELTPVEVDDNVFDFYHVFVGSFSDSDGDGIGDLQGLINRLDYIGRRY